MTTSHTEDVATPQTTVLSICTGYGGLDLGLSQCVRACIPIAYVERDAFACANLVSKMEQGALAVAPVWTNVETFPWLEFRDKVGILVGGYPCQPFSQIGLQSAECDERHLWPFIADGIAIMRPRILFFENVERHIATGLREVLADLGGMGYRHEAGIFSAQELGAPHERKRLFIAATLGDADCPGLEGLLQHAHGAGGMEEPCGHVASSVVCNRSWRRVVYAHECAECECCGDPVCPSCNDHYAECRCPGPDSDGIEFIEHLGVEYGRPSTDWPGYPGHPIKPGEPERLISRSQPTVVGEIDGTAIQLAKPAGFINAQIAMGGNGVVPAVAAHAFKTLITRLRNL